MSVLIQSSTENALHRFPKGSGATPQIYSNENRNESVHLGREDQAMRSDECSANLPETDL